MSETDGNGPRDEEVAKASPEEEKALVGVIEGGLRAPNTMGAFTVVGIVVLAAAFFSYRGDRVPWEAPYAITVAELVHQQAELDFKAVQREGEWFTPVWPMKMYTRLREDIYLAAAFAALLAAVFVIRERARAKYNNALVYRALMREVEELRGEVERLSRQAPRDPKP